MKQLCLSFILLITISACESEPNNPIQELDHFVLDDILDHLPFQQFNEFTKAIFRNSVGAEIDYNLSISEDVVKHLFPDTIFTSNEFIFGYSPQSIIEPKFTFRATLKDITDIGTTEVIYCNIIVVGASVTNPFLTIVPNRDYKTTIVHEEFTWMDVVFDNVYSKVLIEDNELDRIELHYQSSVGIIGFKDNQNISWILDRFE